MAINLFLDANIYLSFYALSNADISQLKQLNGVVTKGGDIKLFVSDQLENEVERNRGTKIQESFKALRDDTFKCRAPSFVKTLPQFLELNTLLKDATKKHADLVRIVSVLVEDRQLDADKVVSELMLAAGVTWITNQQFEAARKRFLTGNPPGKKKVTIGDELNWEFLLENVPSGEDLHLVSLDGDYASPTDATKADAFLAREWKKKKDGDLHFYKDLNDFFRLYVPKITLANQAKLNELISALASSGGFATTHAVIAQFPKDADFNDAQVAELIRIKETNSQVGWIEGDPDVAAFYAPVIRRYQELNPDWEKTEIPF